MAECLTIARPYAKAVFAIAKESKAYDEWTDALQLLSFIVEHEDVQKLIVNQTVTHEHKAEFILELIGDKLGEKAKNFVSLLATSQRLEIIPDVLTLFETYKNEELNKLHLTVTSAVKLKAQQKKDYLASLKQYFNKDVEAEFATDKSLLGGIVVRAGDTVVDFSLKGRLLELQESLSCA